MFDISGVRVCTSCLMFEFIPVRVHTSLMFMFIPVQCTSCSMFEFIPVQCTSGSSSSSMDQLFDVRVHTSSMGTWIQEKEKEVLRRRSYKKQEENEF